MRAARGNRLPLYRPQKTWLRTLSGIPIAVITVANLLAAGWLAVDVLTQ